MSLIVQKFGGTSVANLERISHVAKRVAKTFDQGNDVVVILSALAVGCGGGYSSPQTPHGWSCSPGDARAHLRPPSSTNPPADREASSQDLCSTHLPAATDARYFSLRVGAPAILGSFSVHFRILMLY